VSPKKPFDQRVAESIIKAHRATGSGLAYPMSLREMTVAVRTMLKQYTFVEDTNERHKVAGQSQ
jgi:hypothetical protein